MSSRRMDAYTIALAVAAATLLWLLFVIKAHADTCPGCMPPDPEPPPPVSGAACIPQTHSIDGCADRVWLPFVTPLTGGM